MDRAPAQTFGPGPELKIRRRFAPDAVTRRSDRKNRLGVHPDLVDLGGEARFAESSRRTSRSTGRTGSPVLATGTNGFVKRPGCKAVAWDTLIWKGPSGFTDNAPITGWKHQATERPRRSFGSFSLPAQPLIAVGRFLSGSLPLLERVVDDQGDEDAERQERDDADLGPAQEIDRAPPVVLGIRCN
jgi:hypothetical protein